MKVYIGKGSEFFAIKSSHSESFVSFWHDGEACVVDEKNVEPGELDVYETFDVHDELIYNFLMRHYDAQK